MQAGCRAAIVAALGLAVAAPASAQRKTVPEEPIEVVRHLAFTAAESGDDRIVIDGLVISTRVGSKVPTLRVDLCFPRSPDVTAVDRLSAPLTVNRNVLAGSGPSQVAGLPTSIRLETQVTGDTVALKGEIRFGSRVYGVQEQSGSYEEGTGDAGTDHWVRGTSPAPNEVIAKVDAAALRPLLDLARRQRALIQPNQLVAGCSDLREGKLIVRMVAPPRRIAALAAAAKALPGVEAEIAEYTGREDGVRLPARLRDAPDEALLQAFASVTTRVLGTDAAPEVRSNPTTGEHVVLATRDTDTAKALGLRETVAIGLMVGPETDARTNTMVYITQVGSRFTDSGPTPLAISQEFFETTIYTDLLPRRISAALASAFAAEVGGEVRAGGGRR